jgi:serine protease Do
MTRTRAASALLLLLAAAPAARADFDRAAFMRLAMSTVRIEALAPDQHYNMGTGVIVGRGRVITSCHVTGPAPSVRVLHGGLRYPVRLQRADVHHDLCLLDVPEIEGPVVELGSTAGLSLGDTVVAMGFSGGYELQFADGVVRELNLEHELPVIKSSTAFTSGASGGGLYDLQGRLVGILTFRLRGAEDCYYSMAADRFRSWIASDEGFEPLRVLDQAHPLWMETAQAQPAFLRVAALEAGKQWADMLAQADLWLAAEPESPYAWMAHGKALLGLHRDGEAAHDLREATRREPRLAEAWFALARSYAEANQPEQSGDARHHLETLDAALGAQLGPPSSAGSSP